MNVQDRYNSERYPDMTCFLALRNIERNERKERRNRSSPPPGAARLLSCKLYRSPVWGRGALTKAAQGFSP